jgi:hypothetical protein
MALEKPSNTFSGSVSDVVYSFCDDLLIPICLRDDVYVFGNILYVHADLGVSMDAGRTWHGHSHDCSDMHSDFYAGIHGISTLISSGPLTPSGRAVIRLCVILK